MNDQLTVFSNKHLPIVNEKMLSFLQKQTSESLLLDAMEYSIQAGGKRIRPLLFLAALDFCGKQIDTSAYQVAASIEMIHTYSLIHDDLPAMDNDDLRRGVPTNHKVFGEGIAILAGDGLLTEAFHMLATAELNADLRVELIKRLAISSGSKGMIAGQVADILAEKKSVDIDTLQQIHARKTGALIEYSIISGVLLSENHVIYQESMEQFAFHFGIAFQIRDDLLDVLGDEKLIGKKTGMDEVLQKSTYPSLLGIVGAQKAFEVHWQKAAESLQLLNPSYEKTILGSLLVELKKVK